ncbi:MULTISPECIES: hypothetical protein [unclassified Staphylococcus]|uniref:hypothetical protein n=1 Tax=unclassified Staphylococcus TaxID=91994 RepID=UPI00122E69B6|nr:MULTISPECIES: hypothetical protein [unclassified Staphylococcus]KAA2278112.1 hypothetical protein F1592_00910 [Staphylococcus sp. GDX7P312P]KAA2281452.1 hypothetical protein F1591_03100 [Staphylococcus sp. GDX7P459A]
MENQKLIEHRLNAHDERAKNQAEKITQLEKELKTLKDKENERYIEVSRLNAKLDTDSKNTKEVVNRLVESVDKLVDKIDIMTKNYNDYNASVERRFNKVENEVTNFVNSKAVNTQALKSLDENDVDNTMSGKTFSAITLGLIGVVQVFVQYVAPLLFD